MIIGGEDMKNNYKVGLALGSGASRGLAHIGVIQVLEEYNIPIDMISGSSIGALVGALYCCNIDFKYIRMLCMSLHQKDYVDVTVPHLGFIKGDKIQEILKLLTKNYDFNDLSKPLFVTATDLKNKKLEIINEGKLHEAVRASISVPGIFVPYAKDNKVLVDGGVLERVPAGILRNNGADFIIGVDVGFNLNSSSCKSIFHVLYESIDLMEREFFNLKQQEADIMVRVELNDIDPTRFDNYDLCVEKGRMAAEKEINKIIKAISKFSIN